MAASKRPLQKNASDLSKRDLTIENGLATEEAVRLEADIEATERVLDRLRSALAAANARRDELGAEVEKRANP
jgi:hypothetical protein